MGRRRQAREAALTALYVADVAPALGARSFDRVCSIDEAETRDFARRLFEGALERRADLDRRIQAVAHNWTIARMAAVDRNILRLAAYELGFNPETPPKVVIDEAIEIARKFSTRDSSAFINGILDKLKDAHAREGPS